MNRRLELIRNSKFRHFIWPIRYSEWPKFFPMALMMFAILLNLNIVRILKDSIVVTHISSEVINFIKLYGEMPLGVLFVILYTKLCNIMSTEKVFRIIMIFFLTYFSIFAFIFFPNPEIFHPEQDKVSDLVILYPNLKWFLLIWGKWTYVIFYIMGELWAVIVFTLLFWQLANKITRTEEASRFYSFFSFFGQSNLLISGGVILYFKSDCHCLMFLLEGITNKDELMIKSLILIILLSGILILSLHYYVEKFIMYNPKYYDSNKNQKFTLKLGVIDSMKMVLGSRYLGLICILMISYGLAVNLLEGVWFSSVRRAYPTSDQFMAYQGTVLFWTGVFTLICSILGSSIIRHLGWFFGAIITPVMIFSAGIIFFGFAAFEDKIAYIFDGILYISPLLILTVIGGLQNVLGKGAKYSLFDATREMAYIPLNDEMKTKGKAAVDIVGNKIGKGIGALFQSLIMIIFPSATYGDPRLILFLGVIFSIICVIWILSVRLLSKEYKKINTQI